MTGGKCLFEGMKKTFPSSHTAKFLKTDDIVLKYNIVTKYEFHIIH